MNPLYNGWIRRHRGKDETRRPAPWRATPPVVRLTAAAFAHGLALALPEKVVMARPTGVGHALTAYRMPIEGRDEWIAAAERLA